MDDNERKLYPISFLPDDIVTHWGSVSYKIADLGSVDSMIGGGWFAGNTLSELMGTYLERVVGDETFEYYGLQFPIMIKEIKTSTWQPLQVNIPDAEAEERYDSLGKTALWYILDTGEDPKAYLGLSKDLTAGEFYQRCQDGSIKEVLNEITPVKGESILIEPGTVFAAGPGLTILEVSESSELAFNIHNWGVDLPDGEELLLEEAFDLINMGKHRRAHAADATLADRDEFVVKKLDLKDPLHIFSVQPGCFAVYHCLSGEAAIQPSPGAEGFDQVIFKAGQTVLLPSEVHDILLLPLMEGTSLLEVSVKERRDADSYTGAPSEDQAPDPHIRNWN